MAALGVPAPWLMALLLLLALPAALDACPHSCSCPSANEVHCTFRHLPSAPRNLPRDTVRVNLGYNSIEVVGASDFSNLRQLEMLMLHGNDITSVSPGAFYHLRSLQLLKLSYNKLKTIDPSMLEGLSSLVRLHLDHNVIDFIGPFSFTGLTSLRLLQLEGNRLRDLHPHTFITLSLLGTFWGSGLRHLHLADNQLDYLLPGTLQHLSKLEVLSLHGNPWTCDCHLEWLSEWNKKHEGVIKCKKDRESAASENCAVCSSPQALNGSQVLQLSATQLPCERPSLHSPLKLGESGSWEDQEPDLPYTKDLERPLGHLTFVLSDSHGNRAHVACDATRPAEGTFMAWEPLKASGGEVAVNVTLVSLLECEIDRDALQNLWKLVAYYYESPAILERGARHENTSRATFQYSQAVNEDSPYFTELKGHLEAEPAWLLQPRVTLQLNRRKTTSKKLALNFSTFISKHTGGRGGQEDTIPSWAMIQRGAPGRIQSVLEHAEVHLECRVLGSGRHSVEWMLPDLTTLEQSDSRLVLSDHGRLVIKNTTLLDSGLYHCFVRTETGLDIVSLRLTVRERLLSPSDLNGKKMTVEIGGSLTLPCSVASPRPVETSWYLPRNLILKSSEPKGRVYVSQNNTLIINKVTHEDAGEYSCLAANLYGVDMLSHLVVVTGEAEVDSSAVSVDEGESPLFEGEEESEGSGYQEIKRQTAKQTPQRVDGKHRGGIIRPGMKGKRIKESVRKPNKSVKELDPNRWAQILAKANAKVPTVQPTQSMTTMAESTTKTTMTPTPITTPPTTTTTTTTPPTTTTTMTTPPTTTTTTTTPPTTTTTTTIPPTTTTTTTTPPTTTTTTTTPPTTTTTTTPPTTTTTTTTPYPSTTAAMTTTISATAISSTAGDYEAKHQDRSEEIQTELEQTPPRDRVTQAPVEKETQKRYFNRRKGHSNVPKMSSVYPDATTASPHLQSPEQVTQSEHVVDRHEMEGRIKANNKPIWAQRRRPPYRRRRPPQRRIRPLRPTSSPATTARKTFPKTTAVGGEASQTTDKSKEFTLPASAEESVKKDTRIAPTTEEPLHVYTKSVSSREENRNVFKDYTRQNVSVQPTIAASLLESRLETTPRQNKWHEDLSRRTDQTRQNTLKVTTTNPTPSVGVSTSIKPPLLHSTTPDTLITTAKPVLIKPNRSEKGAVQPEINLTTKHTQNPASETFLDNKTQANSRPSISRGNTAQVDRVRDTFVNANRQRVDSVKTRPERPSLSKFLPVHPWIQQQYDRTRTQTSTTQHPHTSAPYWAYTDHFPIWPTGQSSRHYPNSPDRSWHFLHMGGRGTGVTNRPEITAQTAKPTAFVFGPAGTALPRTSAAPRGSSASRVRDLLLRSRLRNRYRQSQLDAYRLAQLAQLVTPKPRISRPTPRPHQAPSFPGMYRPVTRPSIPAATGRPHSTASVLYGSRWHYSHFGPSRLSTALPFPNLMGSGVKPRITSVNTVSVTALAETDVLLPCESSGDPKPALSWTKVSTGATIQANTKHGQRFEVLQNGTFVIKNVQLQDRGQYLCTAQNKFGSDRMVVTLAVQTQAPKIVGTKSKHVSVYLGTPINLDCVALGKPQAQISWILPDRTFMRELGALGGAASLLANGTLFIKSANFSSKGDYRCIASNAAGADTVTYHIHVAALPPTIKEEASEIISIPIGNSVHVHCTAKGQPLPLLKWNLPNGMQMKPTQFVGGRLFVFPNGTLYIKSVSPADAGRYECSAANAVGSVRRLLQLAIRQESPGPWQRPSLQHRVAAMYGSTVYLHCPESAGFQRGTVWRLPSTTQQEHRYSRERHITTFPNGTLRILQLTEKDGGSYVCMFQRPNGEDMELFQVEVLMQPPKIENGGTSPKKVTYGENFQVDCVASGLPDPEVFWSLPDGTVINNALQSDDSGSRTRRYVIFENGTLLLQRVGKRDEGDYTCYAKNTLGEDEMRVSVRVVPNSPKISSKGQVSLWARLGESARMTCDATGEPPPTIIWLSPSNDIITSSSIKYQILSNGTLVVKKVTLTDQGKYTCVARNSAGDDIKNVKLQVEVREPHINGNGGRTGKKVLAVSYQTLLLDCRAEGVPDPRITWTTSYGLSLPTPYLGGRFQVHKNGSLELRGIRKTDEGRFLCLAKNYLGEASLAIELEVASLAEKPSFLMPNIEVLPLKPDGGDITLECRATGKPKPEFVWILPNSTVLAPSARLQRLIHYPGNGTLRIVRPVTADKGVYRCLAKNVAGQAEKRYALEPGRKPQIRGTAGPLKISFGQTLNMPCTVDGWPQATITWTLPNGLILDKPQAIGRVTYLANGTLQLRETAKFDRGTYTCKASNTFGSSALSYPVTVMVYPPQITNALPSITRVNRGSAVTLSCIAAGIPKPDISWTLPGRTTLVPSNRFIAQGGIHMTVEGSLVIQDPSLMNSGIYKCNAKNALGMDFKATYLQVI